MLQLHLLTKTPGEQLQLRPVHLNLDFATRSRPGIDAYERLLIDVIRGHLTLFMRRDEVDAAWRWIEPILRAGKPMAAGPSLSRRERGDRPRRAR